MHIEVLSRSVKLSGAHTATLVRHIRAVFAALARPVQRIVLRVAAAAEGRPGRECTVEVHGTDGSVTVVHERQRHLGVLLRRAVERAWRAASTVLAPARPAAPALVPVPVRSARAARSGRAAR